QTDEQVKFLARGRSCVVDVYMAIQLHDKTFFFLQADGSFTAKVGRVWHRIALPAILWDGSSRLYVLLLVGLARSSMSIGAFYV
ncbi:MAG: hypothetical protein HYZ81_20090, partial [Nitrospinae bacterium]|nr:hypothetical protein [Nitrospinota bacterium]